jgi:hypothetical protein
MPWCPKCRNEYMTSATRCADCAVDLVDDLAEHDARVAQAESARALRIEGPGGDLAVLEASLAKGGVPLRRVEGALEVPLALAEQIESFLLPTVEFEREGATIRMLGPREDVEPKYQVDPAFLLSDPDELLNDAPATLERVTAVLAAGTPKQKAFALRVLRALDASGKIPLAEFVVVLARHNRRTPLYAVARLFADPLEPGIAARLATELPRLSRTAVEAALHALSLLGDRSIARAVVDLLEHDDADVRAEADEVLMSLTGIDVQFDAEADARTRGATIRLWRERIDRELGA